MPELLDFQDFRDIRNLSMDDSEVEICRISSLPYEQIVLLESL